MESTSPPRSAAAHTASVKVPCCERNDQSAAGTDSAASVDVPNARAACVGETSRLRSSNTASGIVWFRLDLNIDLTGRRIKIPKQSWTKPPLQIEVVRVIPIPISLCPAPLQAESMTREGQR